MKPNSKSALLSFTFCYFSSEKRVLNLFGRSCIRASSPFKTKVSAKEVAVRVLLDMQVRGAEGLWFAFGIHGLLGLRFWVQGVGL